MRVVVLLFLMCGLLFGATPKDTLVVAVESDPDRINPVFSEDHDAAIGIVFSGLTRFDESMRVAPDLAKSWEVSADGLSYKFLLRNDVLWHDGAKFSAHDVAFTLNALRDPKLNAPTKVNFDMVKDVQVVNDYEVAVTLSRPFPAFLDALSVGMIPKHLLEGKDINTDTFNQKPIGTGPYMLKEWKKRSYIRFDSNPNYHFGEAKTKKLILKHVPDLSLSAIELKNQSVDVALVGFEFVETFKNDKRFSVLIEDSADYRALMYNFENPVFADKNVRLALNYAVDKEAILANMLHNLGSVANHPLQKSWASVPPSTHEYNPQKAIKLLEQAGWKKNAQGIFTKDGKVLSFEMYAFSSDPLRVALVNLLKSEFAKIGVEAKAYAMPSGSFDYMKVDSLLIGWGSPYDPDFHTFRVFESTQDKEWNFGHYKNATVDKALSAGRSTLDQEKRKEAYAEFIGALTDDPPFLFLVYLQFPLVYNNNVKGIKPHVLGHHGVGFTWNVHEWSK